MVDVLFFSIQKPVSGGIRNPDKSQFLYTTQKCIMGPRGIAVITSPLLVSGEQKQIHLMVSGCVWSLSRLGVYGVAFHLLSSVSPSLSGTS